MADLTALRRKDSSLKEEPEVLKKTIWSVAGGKGGTGKSVLATNLAIGMSVLGYRVILIDADLGVPNLHNYLGIKRPERSLDDFLVKKYKSLYNVIIETPLDNLKFISGAANLVEIANLPYQRKMRMIRHINQLKADIIIVDLGAGITNNTLDFFNLSSRGIVVTNPEPNANQDAYFFLKSALYRRMKQVKKQNKTIDKAVMEYTGQNGNGTFDFSRFRDFLEKQLPDALGEYDHFLEEFNPRLILNKLRLFTQKKEGPWFVSLVKSFLGVEMQFIGSLKYDKRIIQSSEKVYPFLIHYPKSKVTKNLYTIIDTLNSSEMPIHEVRTYKEFLQKLKEEKNRWY